MRWSVLGVVAIAGASSCGDRALEHAGGTATDSGDPGTTSEAASGSASTTGPATSTSSGETSDALDTTTAAQVDCEGFVGVVTPEQLALTPRANPGAEWLGHLFTDEVVVPDDIYARALEDRDALDELGYLGCFHGTPDRGKVMLSFVEHHDEALAGTYEPWRCVNEYYGAFSGPVESSPIFGRGHPIVLYLAGRFDVAQIIPDYQGLPGVDSVEEIVPTCHADLELPSPIDALYACPEGDTWHYFWTDAYAGQVGFPITTGAHLTSLPGQAPAVVCSWTGDARPCTPPPCVAEQLARLTR